MQRSSVNTVLPYFPSLGGPDDARQLRKGLQSSHRLDPAPGEVGENRRSKQVISLSLPMSPFYISIAPRGVTQRVCVCVCVCVCGRSPGSQSQTEHDQ